MTDADPHLVADLKIAEGWELVAYPDTRGFWTCGCGHKLPTPAPGKSWAGFTVAESTAEGWLDADIRAASNYAKKLPEWVKLDTDCRQNALIELCFNMGGKWGQFVNTRAAIEKQDWQAVHDGLLNSAWAKEVQPHGFDEPGRATRIAGYFLTGQYPTTSA